MARKQTMKVYHGVPKSVTDENTVFYESFDGVLLNTYASSNNNAKYISSATGYGHICSTLDEFNYIHTFKSSIEGTSFTLDFWATLKTQVINSYAGRLIQVGFNGSPSSYYNVRLERDASNKKFHIWGEGNLAFGDFDFSSNNVDKPTHFRIIFNRGQYIKFYINGKEPSSILYNNKLPVDINSITTLWIGGKNFVMSDLHVSNIDRGDYFPNLPQDFIEGKAIIKPRMGQQQIKGDPMYNQVTLDKVKIGTNVNEPQITCSRTSGEWASADTIKVKGLNGEVISGVIDSDTAICKIVRNGDGSVSNTHTKYVDDTTKVEVGDTLLWCRPGSGLYSTNIATVLSKTENSITVQFNGSYSDNVLVGDYYIETTASSSSPIVKTADGTNVVGTWSGLGTNEATFTLGSNSSIAGKDLYVEYALTIPYGNSDFPELPHSTERAWSEDGVEMKPNSLISIVDDFSGKISGSIKECPHVCKWATHSTSLLLPDSFSSETKNYALLNSIDNNTFTVGTQDSTKIPQQLFKFNLIELVERKIGTIPSSNKLEWIRDNYERVRVDYTGYGVIPSGNLVKITLLNQKTSTWMDNWLHISTSVASSKYGEFSGSTNFINLFPDGNLYVLVHTTASDGVSPSTIYTDYISVRVDLKYDSTYTVLYCENPRAREDKCNPVLIQKETKTVKRFLPSKECFTTECVYANQLDSSGVSIGNYNLVSNLPYIYLTTQGTGSYNSLPINYYRECLAKLGGTIASQSYKYLNDIIENQAGAISNANNAPVLFKRYIGNLHYTNTVYSTAPPIDSVPNFNVVYLKPFIVEKNGELLLFVHVREVQNSKTVNEVNHLYKLTNRPLIK